MKKIFICLTAAATISPAFGYASLNVAGQTGLIATPTARINSEGQGGNAVTGGFTYFNNGRTYNVPQVKFETVGVDQVVDVCQTGLETVAAEASR